MRHIYILIILLLLSLTSFVLSQNKKINSFDFEKNVYSIDSLLYRELTNTYGEKWYRKNDFFISAYLHFTDGNWNHFVYQYRLIEGDSLKLVPICNELIESEEFINLLRPKIAVEKERFKTYGNRSFYLHFRKLKRRDW